MSEEKLTVKIMVAENLEKGIEIRDMGMEEVAAEEGTTNINDRGGREGPLLKHWPLRSPSRIVRQDVAARRGATMRLMSWNSAHDELQVGPQFRARISAAFFSSSAR